MAENYKILAQESARGEVRFTPVGKSVYTVPANTSTSISSVSVINNSSATVDYSLGVIRSENAASSVETFPAISAPFIAYEGGDGNLMRSLDGITWTLDAARIDFGSNKAAYGGGKYVVGYGNTVKISNDSITWTTVALPENVSASKGIFYHDNKFIAYGDASLSDYGIVRYLGISYDGGLTWVTGPQVPNDYSMAQVVDLFFAFNNYVMVLGDNKSYLSTDLNSFSYGFDSQLNSYTTYSAYNEEIAVMVGQYGLLSIDSDFSVVDSIGWGGDGANVAYGNGVFVVCYMTYGTEPGIVVRTSTDGINWSAETPTGIPFNSNFSSRILFNKGIFVLLTQDTSSYSSDGVTWSSPAALPATTYGFIPYLLFAGDEDPELSAPLVSVQETIIPSRSIAAGSVEEIVGGITLESGDQVIIDSESEELSVHIYGVELS